MIVRKLIRLAESAEPQLLSDRINDRRGPQEFRRSTLNNTSPLSMH